MHHKSNFGVFNFYYRENPDMSETSGHASPSICTVRGPGMAGFGVAGGRATPPSQALSVAVVLLCISPYTHILVDQLRLHYMKFSASGGGEKVLLLLGYY